MLSNMLLIHKNEKAIVHSLSMASYPEVVIWLNNFSKLLFEIINS